MKIFLVLMALCCGSCAQNVTANKGDAVIIEGYWSYTDRAIVIVKDAQSGRRYIATTGGQVREILPTGF